MWKIFEPFTIKGKLYKRLIQQLCNISDRIFFTSVEDDFIAESLDALYGRCKGVDIPSDIRRGGSGSVVGYKIDGDMIQDLYTYDNLNELLGDRMSSDHKTIFFYRQDEETAHTYIHNIMDGHIEIITDDKRIGEEFSMYEPMATILKRGTGR